MAEIDLGVPRWGEDPAHIINALANYLKLADPAFAPDRVFRRAAENAEAKAAELAARAARSRGRLFGRIVAHSLRRARETAGMREYPKFRLIVAFAVLRRQLQQVGEELADAGRIQVPDDVFFLDLTEARVGLRGADLRGPVAERRQSYQREMRRRRIPRLLLSDGTDVEAAMAARTRAASSADGQAAAGNTGGDGGLRRHRHRQGKGHPGPGRRALGARRNPRCAVDGSWVDAAVHDRRGTGHGNGRTHLPRCGGGPRIRDSRRRRCPRRNHRIRTGDTVTVDGAAGTVAVEA